MNNLYLEEEVAHEYMGEMPKIGWTTAITGGADLLVGGVQSLFGKKDDKKKDTQPKDTKALPGVPTVAAQSEASKPATTKYLLIGGGIVALGLIIYLFSRE